MNFILIVAFFFSTGFIASVNGLNCYDCTYIVTDGISTLGDEKCKTEPMATDIVECAAPDDGACTSKTLRGVIPLNVIETYSRACAPKPGWFEMGCRHINENVMAGIECFCVTDSCNKKIIELPCKGADCNTTVDPPSSSSAKPPCEGENCSSSTNIKLTTKLVVAIPFVLAKYYL